jgi:hypothetical protein
METLERMIAELPTVRAPRALKERILARIAEATERTLRLYRFLFGAISLASVALMVPAASFAIREFSRSAFASYFSLFFSDSGMAIANWKELVLSLAESAPMVGITLTLAAVFVLLSSMRAFARYTGHSHFSHAAS